MNLQGKIVLTAITKKLFSCFLQPAKAHDWSCEGAGRCCGHSCPCILWHFLLEVCKMWVMFTVHRSVTLEHIQLCYSPETKLKWRLTESRKGIGLFNPGSGEILHPLKKGGQLPVSCELKAHLCGSNPPINWKNSPAFFLRFNNPQIPMTSLLPMVFITVHKFSSWPECGLLSLHRYLLTNNTLVYFPET